MKVRLSFIFAAGVVFLAIAVGSFADELKREIVLGYNKATGNTRSSALTFNALSDKKTVDDQLTLKAGSFYSSTNNKMDAKKYNASARYALTIALSQWYSFYKVEAEQDRFADIDLRAVPSAGVGYWFFDEEDFKLLAEVAAGWEHTQYKSGKKDTNEAVLIPRGHLEKTLFNQTKLMQDIVLYPVLDTGEYRLHSETALTNLLSQNLALRLSLIDDFNSSPQAGVKKNDMLFMSSLVYMF
ncbi:MAG: DUF481 domain-containing protein [Candidatus Omnitrophota bacterium]